MPLQREAMETNGQWLLKAALHTVDKCHKLRGQNSLREESCNNPTLTYIYLMKSSLFILLIVFIHLLYHVY